MKDIWLAWPEPLRRDAQRLLELALDEDLGEGDVTAQHFGDAEGVLVARLVAREAGVLAGMPLFVRTFHGVAVRRAGGEWRHDESLAAGPVALSDAVADGDAFESGALLARLEAPGPVLYGAERTALNFLQGLSGVATATAAAVAASAGPAVMDTRKTTPGQRLLEKYAVRMGGGRNHRLGLYDAAMVKDNHKQALGGIHGVMSRVGALPAGLQLIIEVDNLAELAQVLDHSAASRVQRILLDNFPPEAVEQAVALRRARGGGPEFEISGGLSPEDLADPRYAEVEVASLGCLTHSARALDLAIEVEP